MEDSTTMYRPATPTACARRIGHAGIVLAVTAMLAAGCSNNAAQEPTVPTVNFTPKLVLEVNDDGFAWKRGPLDDQAVTVPDRTSAPTARIGTVVELANTGRRDHWIDAMKTMNTGVMKPGEKATVVLSEELTEPKTAQIVDRLAPDHKTSINLVPRPTTS
jgi:hypothetical protein